MAVWEATVSLASLRDLGVSRQCRAAPVVPEASEEAVAAAVAEQGGSRSVSDTWAPPRLPTEKTPN